MGLVFIDGYSSRGTNWKVYDHLQNKGNKNQIRWCFEKNDDNNNKKFIKFLLQESRQKKWHFPTEKTRGELTKNAQFTRIFWDSPSGKSFVFQTFSLRLIRVFVPLSISFPIQWTPVNMRLLTFTDRLTLGERLVFRHLPWVFRRENLEFTAVNEWNPALCGRFPVFSETVNTAESRKIACIPAFTVRKTARYSDFCKQFSFILRDSEFK